MLNLEPALVCPFEFHMLKEEAIKIAHQDGLALENILKGWNADVDVAYAAVCNNPFAITYVDPKIIDSRLAEIAVKASRLAWFLLPYPLRSQDDIENLQSKSKLNLPLEHIADPQKHGIFYPKNKKAERIIRQSRYVRSRWVEYTGGVNTPLENYFMQNNGRYDQPTLISLKVIDASPFIRDSHVTLHSKKHLIPYPFKNNEYHYHLISMVPSSAHHFFIDENNGSIKVPEMLGSGFKENNVAQAILTSYEQGLSFKLGKTCIEGGNCFLFSANGQQHAILGEITIYISMVALEEQGYFENMVVKTEEPDLSSFQMARNLDLHSKIIMSPTRDELLRNLGGTSGYLKLLLEPLSQEDQVKYLEEARKIEDKINLTKSLIAHELELPLENILFFPQMSYHIDMEMFVTPDGEVILHDDRITLEFLKEIRSNCRLDAAEEKLLGEYEETTAKNLIRFQNIQETRINALKTSDIAFRFLPAVLKSPEKSALNYCNGIFVESEDQLVDEVDNPVLGLLGKEKNRRYTFITTGPSFPEENLFHNRFSNVFNRTFPYYILEGIPGISRFVLESDGGVHCLTA